MVLVDNHHHLLEHQLPGTKKSQSGLAPLSWIALLGGNYGEIVKTSLQRQEQIGHISVLETKNGQECVSNRLSEIAILHRWCTDDGHRDHRISTMSNPCDMHHWIGFSERVVAEVIAKGTLHPSLPGNCVTFDYYVAVSRYPKIIGLALHNPQPPACEKSCEFILTQIIRQRGDGAEGKFRWSTQTDGNRHPTCGSIGVVGTMLVSLPMQADLSRSKHLTSIHSHIMLPALRVCSDY